MSKKFPVDENVAFAKGRDISRMKWQCKEVIYNEKTTQQNGNMYKKNNNIDSGKDESND